MMLKLFFTISIMLQTYAFAIDVTPYNTPYTKDELIVNQINAEVAKKLEAEYQLVLIGTGGQMMNEIEKLMLSFNYFQEVDLPTARKLLVVATQTYMDAINQNQKIRRYLKNYPFTIKNIEIEIWFRKPNSANVSHNKLEYASANKGILRYDLPDSKFSANPTFHKETYEEALQIVRGST